MKATKNRTVDVKDLQVNLFVRHALNQDHALALAELIEAGENLPPIKVTESLIVIDGRHRKEAYDILDIKSVTVEVIDVSDESELIAMAYKANVGGALPPTMQDTEHTVTSLLELGKSVKAISELLNLPASLARKYVNEVKSKLARTKLQRAAAAITDGGLTLAKAAALHGVDIDKLKNVISGHRRSHKNGVADINRELTAMFKSVSQRNAGYCKTVLEKHEDGDVSDKQALDILEHLEKLQKNSAAKTADWKNRLLAKIESAKKAG